VVAAVTPTGDGYTIQGLFAERPGSRALFDAVRAYIESLGPVDVVVTKTQVSFGNRIRFAWVWLPQMWMAKRPEESITLAFGLDRQVADPRIEQAVEPRPGRWTHHVVIETIRDFDPQVKSWLREAYALAAIERRRKRPTSP
jgi:hypothetical protein